MQRPLPDKTQHTHDTDIHVTSGIRNHNPSQQAAAGSRLKHCHSLNNIQDVSEGIANILGGGSMDYSE